MRLAAAATTASGILALAWILATVIARGSPAFSWTFFTGCRRPPGRPAGSRTRCSARCCSPVSRCSARRSGSWPASTSPSSAGIPVCSQAVHQRHPPMGDLRSSAGSSSIPSSSPDGTFFRVRRGGGAGADHVAGDRTHHGGHAAAGAGRAARGGLALGTPRWRVTSRHVRAARAGCSPACCSRWRAFPAKRRRSCSRPQQPVLAPGT